MILSHVLLDTPLDLVCDNVCSIIIENPALFRELSEELTRQSQGEDGRFVLFNEQDVPQAISKKLEVHFNPIDYQISKPLQTKFLSMVGSVLSNELNQESFELTEQISRLLFKISQNLPFDSDYDQGGLIQGLLKGIGFKPHIDDGSPLSSILSYLEITSTLLPDRCLCFIGFRQFFTSEELNCLHKTILYRHIPVVFIDRSNFGIYGNQEKLRIIDKDLCQIS